MERQKLSTYKDGLEIPDSKPMALPVDFRRPPPIGERIRALVRSQLLQRELAEQGVETFEEADDFDVPDDPADPLTPYEENFDPLHTTAREMELRAGAVEDRSYERKEKAKETIRRAAEAKRKGREPDKRKRSVSKADSGDEEGPGSSGGDDD